MVKDGPAHKAGVQGRNTDQFLQAHGGDIITALDGFPVKDTSELISYIENNKSVEDKIIITVYRNDQTFNLTAILGERAISSTSLS